MAVLTNNQRGVVDEVRKRVNDVGERLVTAEVDLLGLDGLHEALGRGRHYGPSNRAAHALRASRDTDRQRTVLHDPNGAHIRSWVDGSRLQVGSST